MEYHRHIAVFWPERVRVAGIRVRRMTLGHLRVLEAIGSPFIHGGSATPADAAAALLILSRPWRTAQRLVARDRTFRFCVAATAAAMSRRASASQSITSVGSHISTLLWVPEPYLRDDESDDAPFAPAFGLALRLAVKASRLNLSVLLRRPCRDIFDAPVDELLMWLAASAEADGREFETSEESQSAGGPHG